MKNIVGAIVVGALFAAPVMAADLPRMPVKAVPAVAPAFSWTGCYVGVHGGYAWGHTKWFERGRQFAEHDIDGGLVGGQAGCNFQHERLVLGIEGQASWADLKGNSVFGDPANTNFREHTKTDFLG